MKTKPERDGMMAGLSVDLQLWNFLEPESEPFSLVNGASGDTLFKTKNRRLSIFSCASILCLAAAFFVFTLFWTPTIASQPIAINPMLTDTELAIVYSFEQPHTKRFSTAKASDPFHTSRHRKAPWLQAFHKVEDSLRKMLLLIQVQRLRSGSKVTYEI